MSAIIEEGIGFGGPQTPHEGSSDAREEIEDLIDELEKESGIEPSSPESKTPLPNFPTPAEIEENRRALEGLAEEVKNRVDQETPGEISARIASKIPQVKLSPQQIKATKKLVDAFRDNMKKEVEYLSYEGSVSVLVQLSLKPKTEEFITVKLKSLPEVDRETIKKIFKLPATVDTIPFGLDEHRDFMVGYSTKHKGEKIVTFINTVVNPRPEDLKDAIPLDDKVTEDVASGYSVIKTVLSQKDRMARLVNYGKEPNRPETTSPEPPPAFVPPTMNTVNKNAYEIRADVLKMSMEFFKWQYETKVNIDRENNIPTDGKDSPSSEKALEMAKKFYQFVENKR